MSVYDYIKNNVNVKISPSKISGVGVFALRDIEIGEDLFVEWKGESCGYEITQSELDTFEPSVRAHIYDMFQYNKIDGIWQFKVFLEKDCYWIFKTPTHWINSCSWDSDPNVDLVNLKSIKTIKAGTELLTKYGKYQKNNAFRAI